MTTPAKPLTPGQIRQRAEASERMRVRHEANRRLREARDVSEAEITVAEFAGRTEESEEDMAAVALTTQAIGGVGSVTHRGPVRVRLYDSAGNIHLVAGTRENLTMLLQSGLFPVCPICGGKHADNSFNACKGREPLLYTRCDICARYGRQKFIPDERLQALSEEVIRDPNFVVFDLATGRDAKERLKMRLDAHTIAYHQNEARAQGLLRGLGVVQGLER